MGTLVSDVCEVARSLRKQPRFLLVASVTLALRIGAVTAIFSVVNGVLLRPLPYRDPDRLVNIWSSAPGMGYDQFPLSPDCFCSIAGITPSSTTWRRTSARGST